MAGALEWESYARYRKGLRVSGQSDGDQRATYFLQLPYRFAVPLIAFSILLHFLVSRVVSMVIIDRYVFDLVREEWQLAERTENCGIYQCHFSLLAMIVIIVVGGSLVLALMATSMRRLLTDMPAAANCSLIISAACHLPKGEDGYETSITSTAAKRDRCRAGTPEGYLDPKETNLFPQINNYYNTMFSFQYYHLQTLETIQDQKVQLY
ncbi:hypothetical protein EJ04DRAFT_510377 [Polyplosphaeria fusca]|uniref:Uncharacterized protein n=1 Tax=Polyplosphaeria fusca TaxID=682080 RepID=A0A9P4R366_9PLEO|nr:hypothetical protein EJ04DRAFT_510377 [Polyplosphaeria fusca]